MSQTEKPTPLGKGYTRKGDNYQNLRRKFSLRRHIFWREANNISQKLSSFDKCRSSTFSLNSIGSISKPTYKSTSDKFIMNHTNHIRRKQKVPVAISYHFLHLLITYPANEILIVEICVCSRLKPHGFSYFKQNKTMY